MNLLLLALSVSLTLAATVRGTLSISDLRPADYFNTALSLSLPSRHTTTKSTAFLRPGGQFTFENVTPGAYRLELDSVPFSLPHQYRIDVLADNTVTVHKVLWGHGFEDLAAPVDLPLVLKVDRRSYIVPRPTFSLIGMLKSPMMLMSLFSLVMVFAMPWITSNLDEETLSEMRQQQGKIDDAVSNPLVEKAANFDMAEYMAKRKKGKAKGKR